MRIAGVFLIAAIIALGLGQQVEAQYQNGIPVLLYHQVNNENKIDITVTTETFDEQMKKLYQAGFKTITTDELIAYMSGKNPKLPDRPILISFDDGYIDNYTQAFPILKKYGFKAAIFMVGINIDAPERLSSKAMREMSEYGIEFGAHSMTHRDMTSISKDELRKETRQSKKNIEKVIGKEVKLFAYPYGYYNLSVWEDVVQANFTGALTVLSGPTEYGYDNIYLMRRVPVYRQTDFDTLFERLKENKPKIELLDYVPEFPKTKTNAELGG